VIDPEAHQSGIWNAARYPALVVALAWSCALAVGVVLAPSQPILGVVAVALAIPCLGLALLVRPAGRAIALAFAEITYFFFTAVPTFGAHEGINGFRPPKILDDPVLHPTRMYYFTLAVCVLVYLALRYLSRTAFGLALQGVRDDPVRMTALGFNVRLNRLVGFAVAAPIAGTAGVLSAWSNTRMSADSVSLSIAILVLTAAVIGGLLRLEGAWVGAFVYTLLDTYARGWSDRFATWLGLIFLVIVLISPGGVVGLITSLDGRLRRRFESRSGAVTDPSQAADQGSAT